MSTGPRYLRTRAAALFVALSSRTLEKLRITGGGPAFLRPTQRCVVYAVEDLEEWMLARRRHSTSAPGAGDDLMPPASNMPLRVEDISGLRNISAEAMLGGVYFLIRAGELQYIGQSKNVASRISSHQGVIDFDSVFVLECAAGDRDSVEGALIRAFQPPLNGKTPKGRMRAPLGNPEAEASLIRSLVRNSDLDVQ